MRWCIKMSEPVDRDFDDFDELGEDPGSQDQVDVPVLEPEPDALYGDVSESVSQANAPEISKKKKASPFDLKRFLLKNMVFILPVAVVGVFAVFVFSGVDNSKNAPAQVKVENDVDLNAAFSQPSDVDKGSDRVSAQSNGGQHKALAQEQISQDSVVSELKNPAPKQGVFEARDATDVTQKIANDEALQQAQNMTMEQFDLVFEAMKALSERLDAVENRALPTVQNNSSTGMGQLDLVELSNMIKELVAQETQKNGEQIEVLANWIKKELNKLNDQQMVKNIVQREQRRELRLVSATDGRVLVDVVGAGEEQWIEVGELVRGYGVVTKVSPFGCLEFSTGETYAPEFAMCSD